MNELDYLVWPTRIQGRLFRAGIPYECIILKLGYTTNILELYNPGRHFKLATYSYEQGVRAINVATGEITELDSKDEEEITNTLVRCFLRFCNHCDDMTLNMLI